MEFIMRTINTCLLSLFIALFALPTFADDALIAELIRLDEARRDETQTLHIEYDVVRTYANMPNKQYKAPGNVWEKNGKDKFRYRQYVPCDLDAGDLMLDDVSVDTSARYELRLPAKAFPVEEPLDLCKRRDYEEEGYYARILKNPPDVWFVTPCPFLTPPVPESNVRSSYRELFEKNPPTRVEKIQNDDGDEIVQVDLSGTGETTVMSGAKTLTYRWSATIDFNLSKGGLVSKYSSLDSLDDDTRLVERVEGIVTKFEEIRPGYWYQQELQTSTYRDDQKDPLRVSTYTITNFTLNEKSANQLDDVQFPAGLIVFEIDDQTNQETYHIWGEDGPEHTFPEGEGLHEHIRAHVAKHGTLWQKVKNFLEF
jgi:hypothetical protein